MGTTSYTTSLRSRERRSGITAPSRLRLLRLCAGITIAELSLSSGLSAWTISRIERDVSLAKPGEIDVLRAAIRKVASERQAKPENDADPATEVTFDLAVVAPQELAR